MFTIPSFRAAACATVSQSQRVLLLDVGTRYRPSLDSLCCGRSPDHRVCTYDSFSLPFLPKPSSCARWPSTNRDASLHDVCVFAPLPRLSSQVGLPAEFEFHSQGDFLTKHLMSVCDLTTKSMHRHDIVQQPAGSLLNIIASMSTTSTHCDLTHEHRMIQTPAEH